MKFNRVKSLDRGASTNIEAAENAANVANSRQNQSSDSVPPSTTCANLPSATPESVERFRSAVDDATSGITTLPFRRR